MNVYTNKELKSKDYIFLFFLYYMGEKKEPLKNKSDKVNDAPWKNNDPNYKRLRDQNRFVDAMKNRMLKKNSWYEEAEKDKAKKGPKKLKF